MDIGSLLHDTPSRGRTERERQQKNTASAPSAVANKPITSMNDLQNDSRPRSASFAVTTHLPHHPAPPPPPPPPSTSEYAPRPGSAASLRDSPNLSAGNNVTITPSATPNSNSGSSYYLSHSEMERVRQLPQQAQTQTQTQTQPLGYVDNEQASTAAPGPSAAPGATTTLAGANLAATANSANSATSSTAADVHGTQPPSQNHYPHRNNHNHSASHSSSATDVFPSFAASARHHPRDPPPHPSPSPTTPAPTTATATTTRDGQNAPRHTHHPSLSHASLHQFTPRDSRDSRDPGPTQTTRPGSARDTTMSYGQPIVKQQQQQLQQSDRRSRRDSVSAGYPIIQTEAPHPNDYQMNDYRDRERERERDPHASKYPPLTQSQSSTARIHAPVPKSALPAPPALPAPAPSQVVQPPPPVASASSIYLPVYTSTHTPEPHPSLSRRYDERPLPPSSISQPSHPHPHQHQHQHPHPHQHQVPHPQLAHPDPLPLPLSHSHSLLPPPAPIPAPTPPALAPTPSQPVPVKVEKKPPVLPPPPRTPSPKLPPAHLGAFVYPSLPFPIPPRTLPPNRRTTLAVVVPNAFLPTSLRHANATRVWGGVCERDAGASIGTSGVGVAGAGGRAPGRSNDEFTAAFGVHVPATPATARGRTGKESVLSRDERKFYTDDSDVIFAALHAGAFEWDKVKEWRRVEVVGGVGDGRVRVEGTGEDVELILRVYPHTPSGKFYGGHGANGLVSSSWGWSHEGCAYEVLSVSPLSRGTARAHGRQTRKARMSEYAALRMSVMDSPPHSPMNSPTHAHTGSSDWSGSSSSPNSGTSPPPTSVSGSGSASTTPETEEFVTKTSALRSTATTTAEDNATVNVNVHAPTQTRRTRRNEKEKEKERQELSNLFRASTAKIGSELDLALETGQVDVSLERSVREERFAHVRLVGGWSWGGTATSGGGLGGGGGVGGRMGFKYDPRALREAVFGSAVGGLKRRKVDESMEVGRKDREEEAKREEGGREDVVLLAEDAASERVVFVYRGLQMQVPPTNADMGKDKNTANPAPAIGSKRPREEEQDDGEYGALYDVFRERRVTRSSSPTVEPAATTTTSVTSTATGTEDTTTTKGVRFAAGSKLADGGGKPQRRRRPGMGSESSGGKVVWRRTLVMRNVCESDVEFGKDGVCLWIKVAPPPVAVATTAAKTSSSGPTTTIAAAAVSAPASASAGGGEKEPRLTRLEVEYDGTSPTAGSKLKKDERRGVVFPCKVWRWRVPTRVTRTPRTQKVEETRTRTNGKMETEMGVEMEVEA